MEFKRPFHIDPPVNHPPKYIRHTWEVQDANFRTVSTHNTEESAKRGLEAAEKNLP